MIVPVLALAIGLMANIQQASAECANACNGHGKCTSYDMCICNRNWQAADCSERVCMFGLAHVDTPKGDLDASGGLSNADKVVIDNNFVYPYGTTEQFPQMQDSDLQVVPNSAHYYMECSNKGRCDRSTGECQCFDGYDGVACQRASCPGFPNSCSGHGICKSIEQLANADHGNVYKLWDQKSTMGCECDDGYFGPDCSQRQCKYGVDPLYLDDSATVKYSVFDFATLSTKPNLLTLTDLFTNGETDKKAAYWSIRFFDLHGEDWVTKPILGGADCPDVVDALESLPNNVIPKGSLECTKVDFMNAFENTESYTHAAFETGHDASSRKPYRIIYQMALWEAQTATAFGELSPATAVTNYTSSNISASSVQLSGHIYRVKFLGNPGKLPQPEIEVYLDGKRPTLISPGAKVITKVWTDGQQGENLDHFADHCDGLTVTIGRRLYGNTNDHMQSFLNGMTVAEKNILKKCLGDSDLDVTNNQDVYNWDKGSQYFPHIIKLVRTVTTFTDGGYYAVVWYDTTVQWDSTGAEGTFRLLNPFTPPDAFLTDNYDVYTTKGTLALTSDKSQVTFGFASRFLYTTNTDYDTHYNTPYTYDGDISCELNANNGVKFQSNNILKSGDIFHCLNKTDIFTMLNWEYPGVNPPHINLYTAERLIKNEYTHSVKDYFARASFPNAEMHHMTHMITTDLSTNWGAALTFPLGRAPTPLPTFQPTALPTVSSAPTTAAGGSSAPTPTPTLAPTTATATDAPTTAPTAHSMAPSAAPSFAPLSVNFRVYKFIPAPASTYEYVAECSNRGICDRDAGVCKCFSGYTSDSCHEQSSLSV